MSSLLQIRVPDEVAEKVKELADAERRSAAQWVRNLIEDRLLKEATAPLVPTDEISIFERCSKEGHVEGPNGGCRCGYLWPEGASLPKHGIPSNAEFEAYKAKPKARRKRLADPPKTKVNKSVSDFEERYAAKDVRRVPDQPVSVMNRGGRPMETQEPSSKSVKGQETTPGEASTSRKTPRSRQRVNTPASVAHSELPSVPSPPSRKPKTCQHSNTIRKVGQPFCTDCGEFV